MRMLFKSWKKLVYPSTVGFPQRMLEILESGFLKAIMMNLLTPPDEPLPFSQEFLQKIERAALTYSIAIEAKKLQQGMLKAGLSKEDITPPLRRSQKRIIIWALDRVKKHEDDHRQRVLALRQRESVVTVGSVMSAETASLLSLFDSE